MSLVCAISGQPPTDPVVSPYGYVFERENIQRHLLVSHRCPVSGQDLSEYSLQSAMRTPRFISPRTGTASRSIPTLIKLFRIELDRHVMDAHETRNEIGRIRDEIVELRTKSGVAELIIADLTTEQTALHDKAEELRQQIASAGAPKRRTSPKRQRK